MSVELARSPCVGKDAVSASLLTNTIYHDSSDTTSSGSDQAKVAYNVDDLLATGTDQRGTVIVCSFDNLRQPQSQKVTAQGGSTDGAVQSITRGSSSVGWRIAHLCVLRSLDHR